MEYRRLHWFWVVLVASSISIFWWRHWRLERSQDRVIYGAAKRYGVEASLVKAIVWRESRFNEKAHGRAEEIGLMQLREEAAEEWADAEHIGSFVHEHCYDPRTNLLAGTWYVGKLLKRYRSADNAVPYALADYNAGRGNVLKWISGAGATNSSVFIEQIGFPMTRDYVTSVMRKHEQYGKESETRNPKPE